MNQSAIRQERGAPFAVENSIPQILPRVTPPELDRYRRQLMKFALMQLRNVAAAEDAVQETLLAALRSSESFAGQSSVKTWLVGILKH
jgi:hypothetical protein